MLSLFFVCVYVVVLVFFKESLTVSVYESESYCKSKKSVDIYGIIFGLFILF